jgi:transposase
MIVPGPTACPCCGSQKLAKIGEDITETLEVIPRRWKVIQYVREKFTCRNCEGISQPPAPFHMISRGHVGPNLLAMVLHDKFALHQPLNRQSEAYAREGIDLSLSTLADHVGSCTALLAPMAYLIRAHVFRGIRIHGDDTTVPLLAKGKTVTARLWTYVRDDAPFGGADPPAAVYYFSRDAAANTPSGTWPITAASSRPTPMPGSTGFMNLAASRHLSPKRRVGPMVAGSFSFSPILSARPATKSLP